MSAKEYHEDDVLHGLRADLGEVAIEWGVGPMEFAGVLRAMLRGMEGDPNYIYECQRLALCRGGKTFIVTMNTPPYQD